MLASTGLVANDLHLMAHDDVTGRPFLQPRAVGLGLAGGLLAEQVLGEMIALWQGEVVLAGAVSSQDELGHAVKSLIVSEHERHGLPSRAGRLPDPGRIQAPQAEVGADRRGLRARIVLRVRAALDPSRRPGDTSAAIAGLAAACGLVSRLLPYGRRTRSAARTTRSGSSEPSAVRFLARIGRKIQPPERADDHDPGG